MNTQSITKGLAVLAVTALLAIGGPTTTATTNWSNGDLIAAQNTKIGTVSIVQVGDDLKVTFTVTDSDWSLDKTHVYVGEKAPSKGSPGKFPYKHEEPDSGSSDVYLIDLGDFDCSKPLYVAAHADVVTGGDCDGSSADYASFCANLPSLVKTYITTPLGLQSFVVIDLSGGTSIDGTYEGWCIDPGPSAVKKIYHYTEPICADSDFTLIDDLDPDNFDMVNYLLNLDPVGTTATDGDAFTRGDMQQAIWTVLFGKTFAWAGGLGDWTQDHVDELVDLAETFGIGFTPDCEDLVAVVLVADPDSLPEGTTEAQIMIVGIPIPCQPCEEEETAWMYGPYSFDKSWGWYTSVEVTCSD